MALEKCSECGEEISTKAKTCPKCGAPNKSKSAKVPTLVYVIFFGFIAFALLSGGGSDENTSTGSQSRSTGSAAVTACVNRGIEYFREIGSYPILTSAPNEGRRAEDIAQERTTTAF